MPEAHNKYSTDYYIYQVTNKISKYLCFLNPNMVTLLRISLIFPILHNVINDGSLSTYIVLVIAMLFTDIFDGSIARICNKVTNLGGFLDVLADTLSIILLTMAIIYKKQKNNNPIITTLLLILCSIYIYSLIDKYREVKSNALSTIYNNKVVLYLHDNISIIILVLAYLLKKYYL